MLIIEDTRQKKNKHEAKHRYWIKTGTPFIRSGLPFGDYWAAPRISIDTKQSIKEVAINLCGRPEERKRFREECDKAKTAGCKQIYLIEDKKYSCIDDLWGEGVWVHDGRVITGDSIAMRMHELQERYGCEFRFCDPSDAGRVIVEMLEQAGESNA